MLNAFEQRSDRRPGAWRPGSPGPMLLERGGFDIETRTRATQGRLRIRCPHCRWQPGRHSIWTCLPIGHPEYFQDACGHSWNTFDTRGLCPCCAHQWLFTSCLACGRWALHEDWYEPDRNNEPGGP